MNIEVKSLIPLKEETWRYTFEVFVDGCKIGSFAIGPDDSVESCLKKAAYIARTSVQNGELNPFIRKALKW